jgi:hypothetical protein
MVMPMPRSTMFAHLATRLGTQPEPLATEMLAYLLAGAPAVRRALADACAVAVPALADLGDRLQFRTVHNGPGEGAPALVGLDAEGSGRIVVDCRFWSSLRGEQPRDRLELLTPGRAGVLVLLAPQARFTALWAELRRRCRLAGLPVHGDHAAGDPLRWTRLGPEQTLILASWSGVLAGARARLLATGDQQTLADLDQLAGLCELQESGSFEPLTPDELSGASARRLGQLFRLVDDLASACEARGLGSVETARATEPGGYGRRLRLGTTIFELRLSVDRWATLRETPFWLLVYDASGRPALGVDARLERLASEIPPRLLRDIETGCPLVPLFPSVGVEREAVLAGLVEQVSEVARLLGEGPTVGFGSRA